LSSLTRLLNPGQPGIKVTAIPLFDFDNSVIELLCQNKYIDSLEIARWERQLSDYDLEFARIDVIQDGDRAYTDMKISEAIDKVGSNNNLVDLLKDKEMQINDMRNEVKRILQDPSLKKDPLEIEYLINGFKQEYEEIDYLSINRSFSINKENQIDTTYSLSLSFGKDVQKMERDRIKTRIIKRFLYELSEKTKTKQDSLHVDILQAK
jgi:phage anti-repressor protein